MNTINKKVLIIATSHDALGDTGEKTGVWLEELAGPYFEFLDSGYQLTIASPKGGEIPIDPKSELPEWQTEFTKRFEGDKNNLNAIKNATKLVDINPEEFDILFFPGGHGPMWDLGANKDIERIINSFDQSQKPIGAVCHGVVALTGIKNKLGNAFVEKRRVTSFTNTEEEAVGLMSVVPFLLEDKLKKEGAIFKSEADWSVYTVEDDNLFTGQNPQSSVETAKKTIEFYNNNLKRIQMKKIEITKQIATSFFEAYKNHDIEKATNLAAENASFRYIPLGSNGVGKVKGNSTETTWAGIANALIGAFPDLTNDVKSITIDNENNAIVQVFIGGTQAKEILGIPSNGKYYNVEHLFMLKINDNDQIDTITCYWDNWDWFQQIGYKPA
jgi:steroid delta-isomerase-like uncharacterized protein